jgi:hypothetical protein
MSVFVDIKHLQKENGFFVGFMKFETTSRGKGFSKLHASHYKLVVYFLQFFLGNPSRMLPMLPTVFVNYFYNNYLIPLEVGIRLYLLYLNYFGI